MSTINIQEMHAIHSGNLRRVEEGETFVVLRDQRRLRKSSRSRKPSTSRDHSDFAVANSPCADDFDSPLPDDVLNDFEGR